MIGGISPIGQKRQHPTLLDASAMHFESIYVSGGKRGMDLELAPADLLRVTKGRTERIARKG